MSGSTTDGTPFLLKLTPNVSTVGAVVVTVVWPMTKVVSDVAEYRHTDTAGLSIGQLANFARFDGKEAAPAG